jgi:hypothetical protein
MDASTEAAECRDFDQQPARPYFGNARPDPAMRQSRHRSGLQKVSAETLSAQEANVFHNLIEEKLPLQRLGMQNSSGKQTPGGAADHNFTEVRPVKLRLLGRKHRQQQKRLRPIKAEDWPAGHRS